jgi:single-stranded DNA-specific DHH superfamily exonuclease
MVLLLSLVFVSACKAADSKATDGGEEEMVDLKDLMTGMVEKAGMKELLESGSLEETGQEEAAFLIGAERLETSFEQGYSLQPMINVHPFAMGLFKVADSQEASAFARELKEKADRRKWICVEAETIAAGVKGRLVLFVMGSVEEVSAITGAAEFDLVP